MNINTIFSRKMDTLTDEQLWQRCLSGDREAYAQIVARYQALICSLAYSACGNTARSEDLAQETFIIGWQKLSELREPAKLKSWLCGIARNLINNSLRRQQRTATELAEPLDAAQEISTAAAAPNEQVIREEEEAIVWRALEGIPETYREPLVLFYREQRSVEQVATSLDLSEEAVRQRLSRGRSLLKEQVSALVENTLGKTSPGKAFTIAVIAALPLVAPPTAAAAAAASTAKGATALKSTSALAALGITLIGPLVGLLGGYLGSKAAVEAARSPRERQFMVRGVWTFTLYALAFAAIVSLTVFFGDSYLVHHVPALIGITAALIIGYCAGLFWLIFRHNKRQKQIQIEEGTYVEPSNARDFFRDNTGNISPRLLYTSVGGGVFGSTCWMVVFALSSADWMVAASILVVAILVLKLVVDAALRQPEATLTYVSRGYAVLAAVSLVIFNWRWAVWLPQLQTNPTVKMWCLIGFNAMLALMYGGIVGNLIWRQRKFQAAKLGATQN